MSKLTPDLIKQAAVGARSIYQVARRLKVHREHLRREIMRYGLELRLERPSPRLPNEEVARMLKAHGRRPFVIAREVGVSHQYVCRRIEEWEADQW